MKKHWVNFTAVIVGSILVEGDESPEKASEYVKRHLCIDAEAEAVDAEINHQEIQIDSAYEETEV
jgi:hypothetical protein